MISSAAYPKSFCAPRFQVVIRPSTPIPTMASFDDSTMADICPRRVSARLRSEMSMRERTTPASAEWDR